MWYQIGKAAHQEQNENSISKTMRKATGNRLALLFPGHDMDRTIVAKDNGVNEAVSQGLVESRSAGNGVRRSRSSSSEILTRVRRKKCHLKVACWNIRTLLQKGNWRT